jgi:hypothetical protein
MKKRYTRNQVVKKKIKEKEFKKLPSCEKGLHLQPLNGRTDGEVL